MKISSHPASKKKYSLKSKRKCWPPRLQDKKTLEMSWPSPAKPRSRLAQARPRHMNPFCFPRGKNKMQIGERKMDAHFSGIHFSFPAGAGRGIHFLSPLGPRINEILCSAHGAGPSSRLKGGTHFSFPAQKVTFPGI